MTNVTEEQLDRLCNLRHEPIEGHLKSLKENSDKVAKKVDWIQVLVITALVALVGNLLTARLSPQQEIKIKLVTEDNTQTIAKPAYYGAY